MSTILSGHQIKYRAHRFECLLCGARLLNLMQFNGRECPRPRAVAEPPMTAPTGTEATTARIAEVLAEHETRAAVGEHALVWEFDRDTTTCRAICNAAEDADCRLVCNADCETWSEIVRHEDVSLDGKIVRWITHDDCEGVMHPGECNVCLYLNESGCIEELALGGYPNGPRFTIATVPIRPSWEGDGYEWEPLRIEEGA
jgi:hypothetical protein